MIHKKNLDPKLDESLRQQFEVQPQPDFLPALKSDLMDQAARHSQAHYPKTRKTALVLTGVLAALVLILFITPVRDAIGQVFVEFFQKSESNVLPNYPGQTAIARNSATAAAALTVTPDLQATQTPRPTNPYSPSSKEFAEFSIEEVEELAGFDVLAPTYLPKMQFYGANYDPETQIVYLFYDGHMLIAQEPITGLDDCDLCNNEVGSTARIVPVQIGTSEGEYVIGTWHLKDENKYWRNDLWIRRILWESDNTVFELLYDGLPGSLSKEDLVEIAESFQ